jgi:hypothetical protein
VCRNIKRLANLDPPATPEEIRASAAQFVRKLLGTTRTSRVNRAAFDRAVEEVAAAAGAFLGRVRSKAPPRSREDVARKADSRS